MLNRLTDLAAEESQELKDLIEISYNDLAESIELNNDTPPSLEQVEQKVLEALRAGYVGVTKINSENQIAALLDRSGQLRLDNPFNVFVGGQILDRGITIDNLIGFCMVEIQTLFNKTQYYNIQGCMVLEAQKIWLLQDFTPQIEYTMLCCQCTNLIQL